VVLGEFPQRKACGRFLELFLKLVLRSLPDAPASDPVRLRRPVQDLIFPEGYVVGRSERMMSVYHQLRHLLSGDLPVLITGETGVGKEFIARILHTSSARTSGPFVAVNCAALPADLLEAELFGIEAGVATGVNKRDGKMRLAEGGVVFLDEIGDMSPALQAKLLRALQEKEVHPVGARRPVPLDVRVVAATNTDLHERIGEGRFRSDLYYRIAGYTLDIPPLRERRGDIAALVEFMMQRVALEIDKPISGISVKALRALVDAPWPGNVRELEHEVRRLVCLCPPDQPITAAIVSPSVLAPGNAAGAEPLDPDTDLTLAHHTDALERRLITLALARTQGKRATAARLLGISRYGLALKMQRLGLDD
jgi:transcriptional regulator with GAF, ATPase, and Fis domain